MTNKVPLGKLLDPILVVLRVTEAITAGLTFVKELGWDLANTKLGFAFKRTKLKGRELMPWTRGDVFFSPGRVAHEMKQAPL